MTNGKRRVLVIEDNRTDALLIEEALHEHGVAHEMTVLRDGAEALHYLEEVAGAGRPDLIIIDLHLPKHDGMHVLSRYRLNPLLAGTPMVMFSSSDAPEDLLRAKGLGVRAYLRKPMDLSDFLALGKVFRALLEDGVNGEGHTGRHGT